MPIATDARFWYQRAWACGDVAGPAASPGLGGQLAARAAANAVAAVPGASSTHGRGPLRAIRSRVGQPRASIVIPVHGAFAHTLAACARSGRTLGGRVRSHPWSMMPRRTTPSTKLARLPASRACTGSNAGFIAACTDGAAIARGEVRSSSTTTPCRSPAGWSVAAHIRRARRRRAVGARLVFPTAACRSGRRGVRRRFGLETTALRGSRRLPLHLRRDAITSAARRFAVPRALFARLGGFDTPCAAYYEDTDLRLRCAPPAARVVPAGGSGCARRRRQRGTDPAAA